VDTNCVSKRHAAVWHGIGSTGRAMIAARILGTCMMCAAGSAVATSLVNEPFTGATLSTPLAWVLSFSGTTAPCLTAASSASPPQALGVGSLGGCQNPALDAAGSGALRLTNASLGQSGMLLYNTALPTSGGLDITFTIAEYGGGGADGLSFFVKDGANTDTSPGFSGGALGYTLARTTPIYPGIHAGLFGVGFDKWGNYSGPGSDGPSCTPAPGQIPNSIVVRGPDLSPGGTGVDGYCYLGGVSSASFYSGATRAAAARLIRIVVDPASVPSPRKISVYLGSGSLPSTPNLQVNLPAAFIAASTFKFGFGSSTGAVTDNHEVWALNVGTVTPLAAAAAIPAMSLPGLLLLALLVLAIAIAAARRRTA
jgi:hypothetical protein